LTASTRRVEIANIVREISSAPTLESVAGRYQTLRELVSRSLRAAILSGAAPPGQTLRELDVARRLGVSKTPVREAFRELERTGLVVSAPHRGVMVIGRSLEAMGEMLEVRLALEPFAARLAAERITDEQVQALRGLLEDMRKAAAAGDVTAAREVDDGAFHRKIFELSGNARLERLLLDALEYVGTVDTGACAGPGAVDHDDEDHLTVGEAIVRRDPRAAEEHMRRHIGGILERRRAKPA